MVRAKPPLVFDAKIPNVLWRNTLGRDGISPVLLFLPPGPTVFPPSLQQTRRVADDIATDYGFMDIHDPD